jgi:hypothetical protein
MFAICLGTARTKAIPGVEQNKPKLALNERKEVIYLGVA